MPSGLAFDRQAYFLTMNKIIGNKQFETKTSRKIEQSPDSLMRFLYCFFSEGSIPAVSSGTFIKESIKHNLLGTQEVGRNGFCNWNLSCEQCPYDQIH